jgi:hypothetical protein
MTLREELEELVRRKRDWLAQITPGEIDEILARHPEPAPAALPQEVEEAIKQYAEAVRITTAHDDPYRTERSAYEVYEAEEAAKLVALRAAIARAIEGRKP